MPHHLDRTDLVARLVRAGEAEVHGADQDEIDSYFDTERFIFHGPDATDADYAGLNAFFRAFRQAFDDRSIRRGIIAVDGGNVACQTWFEGTFVRPFTHSPVGELQPTGGRVVWDLINIFRFDEQGRLVEEFVRSDNRSLLRQLGAAGA